jgi:hypothetical protein
MESILLGIKFVILQGPHILILMLVVGFLIEALVRLAQGALHKGSVLISSVAREAIEDSAA